MLTVTLLNKLQRKSISAASHTAFNGTNGEYLFPPFLHLIFLYSLIKKPGRLLRPGSFSLCLFSIQAMYSYTTVVYVCYPFHCLQAQCYCSPAHTNSVQIMIAVYSILES